MRYQVRHNRTAATAVILYIKWKIDRGSFVRSWWSSFFMYLQYCSTDLLYTCADVQTKRQADHGHKKGHAPRALQGHSSTGISRPRTEVLRRNTYSSAANTLLRNHASHGHLNLWWQINIRPFFVVGFITVLQVQVPVPCTVSGQKYTLRKFNDIMIWWYALQEHHF